MVQSTPELRIQGIYAQAQEGLFMLRTKVPGGMLSAAQARGLCEIAERFSSGPLHLTTRMSIEFHGVAEGDLPAALQALADAGLTSRGACGGGVRGVAVSTPFAPENSRVREVAKAIHRHFTGNVPFEGLPKKFKVGVDAGYRRARHLIQDVGLVERGDGGFDVWLAGGLGRLPTAAFLFAFSVPEREILPILEAVVRVYKSRAPQGKRLKYVVAEIGEDALRELLRQDLGDRYPAGAETPALAAESELGEEASSGWVTARVFAGELTPATLQVLASLAERFSGGRLVLTPDQDVALPLADPAERPAASRALLSAGFRDDSAEGEVVFRVCPGSHECRLGLAPTREVARALIAGMGAQGRKLTWAISGCPNSCAQPQLADVGIVCTRLTRVDDGESSPRFDLLRRTADGLGTAFRQRISLRELIDAARELN